MSLEQNRGNVSGFLSVKDEVWGVRQVKRRLHEVIPADFTWVFRMDDDVSLEIRYKFIGVRGVTRVGTVSDADWSMLVNLLLRVDWERQRQLARESVDNQDGVRAAALDVLRNGSQAPHLQAALALVQVPDARGVVRNPDRPHAELPIAKKGQFWR